MAITKRLDKGTALTHGELDGNFTDLDGRVTTLETADTNKSQVTNSSIGALSDVDITGVTANSILKYNASTSKFEIAGDATGGGGGGFSSLVQDTTPQLGGVLDANGQNIDMGVNFISDTKVGQWDTAYSWGDHSLAGYTTNVGLENIVEDVTPQLGGALDANGNDIYLNSGRLSYAPGGVVSFMDFTVNQFGQNNNVVLSSVKSIALFLDSNGGDSNQAFRIYNDTNPDGTFNENTYIFKVDESGDTFITGTLNGHTIPVGAGTLALTSDLSSLSYLQNIVEDTTPQLGGALDTNGNNITFSGNTKAQFGAAQDLSIFHNGGHSIIRETGTGDLYLQSDNNVILSTDSSTKKMVKGVGSGEVILYHNDVAKLNTSTSGVTVVDELHTEGATPHLTLKRTDNVNVPTIRFKGQGGTIGASIDFQGTAGTSNELAFQVYDGATIAERFRVTYTGAKVTGDLEASSIKTTSGNTDIIIETHGTGDVLLKGDKVGIGSVNQPDTLLHLKDTNSVITLQRTADANTPGLSFQNSGGNSRAELKMDGTSGTSNEVFIKTDNQDGNGLVERFRVGHTGVTIAGTLNGHTIPAGAGTIALTSDVTGIANVVDDTTPQLGGELDGNGNNIDLNGGYIKDTSDNIVNLLDTVTFGVTGSTNAAIISDSGARFYRDVIIQGSNDDLIFNKGTYTTTLTSTNPSAQNQTITLPDASGTVVLDSTLNSSIDTHLNQSNPTSGYVLSWNGVDYAWVAQSGGGGSTWATLGDKDGPGGPTALVLGRDAVAQGAYGFALGNLALSDGYGIAIGMETQAAGYDVNVGSFSGKNHVVTDHGYRVAVGAFAQQNANPGNETGIGAIAIGNLAGDANQGANAVAIGRFAGRNNQAVQSIVLNATGVDLENVTPDSFVVKPIRQEANAQALYYNPTTGEVTYAVATSGGTFGLAGNTGTHTFNTATETLTFLGTTGQINAGIAANNVTLELDPNINSIVSISFEGSTANSNETKLQATDPTADRTINLPDATGHLAVFTTAPTAAIADGTIGQVLTTDGAGGLSFTTVSGGGGSGTPGGSATQVQFNDSGSFGGDAGMTYNKTSNALTVGTVITDNLETSTSGTPTISSASNIVLNPTGSVVVQSGGFRLANMDTTARNALTASNGEMIYNTTVNKIQAYQNGAWINLEDGSSA